MTTTVSPATTSPAINTTWVSVTEGLWVGSSVGEFRGTIEFVDGRFEAADDRGNRLGQSHSLTGAKRLLDAPDPAESEQDLPWSDDRPVLALGWLALGAAAIAAVSIASQFFV